MWVRLSVVGIKSQQRPAQVNKCREMKLCRTSTVRNPFLSPSYMNVLGHNSKDETDARTLPVTAGAEVFSKGQEILQ
jgi:hypothetical protein